MIFRKKDQEEKTRWKHKNFIISFSFFNFLLICLCFSPRNVSIFIWVWLKWTKKETKIKSTISKIELQSIWKNFNHKTISNIRGFINKLGKSYRVNAHTRSILFRYTETILGKHEKKKQKKSKEKIKNSTRTTTTTKFENQNELISS